MKKAVFTLIFIFLISFCLTAISGKSVLAEGAALFLSPSSNSYIVGEIFSISVKTHTGGTPINAGEASLNFPADLLEITGLSKNGSIFNLWTNEPTYSNDYGTISFGGGTLGSDYNGSSGTVLNINFRAKKEGRASVDFGEARVLAADGKGTNILSTMEGGIYSLEPEISEPEISEPKAQILTAPVISSLTHSNPEKWYSNNSPKFFWEVPADVTGVSILLHENPTSDPGPVSEGLINSKKFEKIEDGIWYFHIKFKNQYGWGEITHRKVLIDTLPPLLFEIDVQKENPADSQPSLLFETADETSGLDHYEIRIGEGDVFPVSKEVAKTNPYKMPWQASGKHLVIVRAVDKAGNFTSASKEVTIEAGGAFLGFKISEALINYSTPMIIFLVVIGLLILFIIYQWYKFLIEKKNRTK
jgi:hypothetical protein